jgi:predicted homoserine dehydrogenase-like protein
MIIVDEALSEREQGGNPIKMAMVGAGFMGRGIAIQILIGVSGVRLVAIANRHIAGAKQIYEEA